MRILLVEDEKDLLETLAESLRLSGYAVDTAEDGLAGEEMAFSESYDLIVLDVNLPKMDGFAVLEKIRSYNKLVNIIMLTARADVSDRVKGLDLGANDYLVKPFHLSELEARIRSLLRRKAIQEDSVISCGDFTFSLPDRTFSYKGTAIRLTVKETGILEYLLVHRGRFVSQEELIDHVWDGNVDSFSNSVRVHMSSLRKKIKEVAQTRLIENEVGRGYVIR